MRQYKCHDGKWIEHVFSEDGSNSFPYCECKATEIATVLMCVKCAPRAYLMNRAMRACKLSAEQLLAAVNMTMVDFTDYLLQVKFTHIDLFSDWFFIAIDNKNPSATAFTPKMHEPGRKIKRKK